MCTECKTISTKFFYSVSRVSTVYATPEPFCNSQYSLERALVSYSHANKTYILELLCSKTHFRQFLVEKAPTNSPEQKFKYKTKTLQKQKAKTKTFPQ